MTGPRRGGLLWVDDRGVSETLGYILVFSIVITTITTATVFGFSGLEDRQAAEEVRNVERAFDVLADNFGDIARYEDPSRATEIRLASGTIAVGDPVRITIGQNSTTPGEAFVDDPNNVTNVTLQPLVFRSDGGDVVYESGVVFRVDDKRSIARASLPFVVDEESALVSTVATTQGGSTSGVGGERTVLVVGERRPNTRPLYNRTVEGDDLRVRIESPRADGWDRRLREEGYQNVSYDAATSTVTADLAINHDGTVRHPEQARLPVTNIAVRFD